MSIGLPLLQALPASEFRAVLAHEFGHYASHDVRLGPWLYRTRRAMSQTIEGLDDSLLSAPFEWYSNVFLDLTFAISRRQEFVADAAAARVAGPTTVATALRRVHAVEPAYRLYFERDVLPVLRSGFLPPIAEGFNRFLDTPRSRDFATLLIAEAERPRQAARHDTHPPLSERIAALGTGIPSASLPEVTEPASGLLSSPDGFINELMRLAIGDSTMGALTPIEWHEVPTTVYVARWRAATTHYSPVLSRIAIERFPHGRHAFMTLAGHLHVSGLSDQRLGHVIAILGGAIAVRLLDTGWDIRMGPGQAPAFVIGEQRFEPFDRILKLADGTSTLEDWIQECEGAGLAGPLCDGGNGAPDAAVPLELDPVAPPTSVRSTRRRRQS